MALRWVAFLVLEALVMLMRCCCWCFSCSCCYCSLQMLFMDGK